MSTFCGCQVPAYYLMLIVSRNYLALQVHIDKGNELKGEANALFAKKEFVKALEVYQQAASSYPHDHADKPQMLCNKAACYTMLKK